MSILDDVVADAVLDAAEEALEALGNTPDAVADTLRAGGWRGVPDNSEECPVACYLRVKVPHGPDVKVDRTQITLALDLDDELTVPTPDAVRDFVDMFDEGEHNPDAPYIDLIAPRIGAE